MKNLLSKQGKRMLEMISYLAKYEWVTLEKLSEETRYSERTLREDIKYLNTVIAPIEIHGSTKSGIRLNIPQGYSIKYIHYVLICDSLNFNLMEELFMNEYKDVGALADRLYSSPTVVTKAITQINQVIKPYHFRIRTNPVKLEGNEQWITAYFRNYFIEKYDRSLPFSDELLEVVQKTINQLYKEEGAVILPMNRNSLVLYTAIRVFRMKQNETNQYQHLISKEEKRPSVVTYNQTLSDFAGLTEVYDFFRDIWRPTPDDKLAFRLDEFQEMVRTSGPMEVIYQEYLLLANRIEEELHFSFKYKEWFIFNLYNIVVQEKFALPILVDKTKLLLPNIKKQVPYIYLTLERVTTDFASKHQLDPAKFLYNVFSAADDFLTTGYQHQPKLKVAIYSRYNNITVANNWNIIKNVFINRFEVTLIQNIFEETPQKMKEDYDLLVTDINNIEVDIDYFCIPYDISPNEISMLEEYYFNAMTSQVEGEHQNKN